MTGPIAEEMTRLLEAVRGARAGKLNDAQVRQVQDDCVR